MVNLLKTLLLLAISLLVVTVLAEFVVRIAFHDITSTPNMQTWFGQRWQAKNVAENSRGFRESEITLSARPGAYRIAIVGDSFTFGQGIPAAERFSDLMEAMLNARGGAGR